MATAAILALIAAVAMFDTRGGALPDPTGTAPGGLKGGWYPFWAGAMVAGAGLVVAYQTLRRPQPAEGAFRDRAALISVVRLVVPMAVVTFLMAEGRLGFYLGSGLYMAYFARFTTGYRWYWAAAAGIVTPVLIFLVFEVGFRALFPKSFFYPTLPF